METLTTHEQELVAASAGLGAGITIAFLIYTAIAVLFVIAWWKIFQKAGLKGWKSIIPIYNQYCLFRISGMSGWWILLPLISGFIFGLGGNASFDVNSFTYDITTVNQPFATIGAIGTFVSLVVAIVQTVKLAGNFGKGTLFKVLSVFFPNITSLILAFGSAKYNKKSLHA